MMTILRYRVAIALLLSCVVLPYASAHQGPDPVVHWEFNNRTVAEGVCNARLGPEGLLSPSAKIVRDAYGAALDLTSSEGVPFWTAPITPGSPYLPTEALTVSTWVRIDEAEPQGGVVGVFGEEDALAWRLGYDDQVFNVTIKLQGNRAIIVTGRAPYQKRQWNHVAAVYEPGRLRLYVNGRLDGEQETPQEEIAYPAKAEYRVGWPGIAGRPPLRGSLRGISIYDLAARDAWVRHEYEEQAGVAKLPPDARQDRLAMLVEPYLQNGAKDGMTVMWETSSRGSSVVHYGETADCDQQASAPDGLIHEVRITGLAAETQYFYRVKTTTDSGQKITSGVSTFTTAVYENTPFAFAVISDTQYNPVVAAKLSKHAWAQRPSFLLHPGDLVDTGVDDAHWTQHFFPGMKELISRVPMYPVLGNHEQNAKNYFEYMSLPSPEYYYQFQYGNAQFLMIDSNRNVGPDSEQYQWLDKALSASTATWKFVCHHHPPYSSDENDYGNLWRTNKSTRGDTRVRQLTDLYEKHNVDLVWNGHIHSYERTWPISDEHAVGPNQGPVYMIVGGGGGNLETPGPFRPFFQNQVRRSHHYVMTHINGDTLEVRSYDLEDRLFDTFKLTKPSDQ